MPRSLLIKVIYFLYDLVAQIIIVTAVCAFCCVLYITFKNDVSDPNVQTAVNFGRNCMLTMLGSIGLYLTCNEYLTNLPAAEQRTEKPIL